MPTKVGRKSRNQELNDIKPASLCYIKTPVGDTLVLTDTNGDQTFVYLTEGDVAYLRQRTGS